MALPFKAVAVDMDGTFLDDNKQFSHKEFDQILNEFDKRGIQFIVASGRPYARLEKDFGEFAERIDFVSLNGSRLIVKGKDEASYPITRQDVLNLISDIQQKYGKRAIMVFEKDFAYLNTQVPKDQRDFLAYFAGKSAEIDDWENLPLDEIYQITIDIDRKYAQDIEADFNNKYDNKISVFGSAESAVDVNIHGINKGQGLRLLLKHMGLTGDDLIAFGDGGNDIAMLEFAKYSYAMANGMDEVKQHAKFVAPANTENGVFRILQKYLAEDD